MVGIFHGTGVTATGAFTQPTIAPTADCVRYLNCDQAARLDPDADNAIRAEFLSMTDAAGLSYDCATFNNLLCAVNTLIRDKISEFQQLHFVDQVQGAGTTLSITLPSGGNWRTIVVYQGGQDGIFNPAGSPGNFIIGIDDNDSTNHGVAAELRPGGYTYSVAQQGNIHGILAVFAVQTSPLTVTC